MAADWDIESYRKEYECDEHWRLREAFMRAYKDQFSEDEVVCLAQVFVNIELLGCRYPLETVQKVARLADELDEVKQYRESRRTTLKRTFIAADDAVAARYNKPEAAKPEIVEKTTAISAASSAPATSDDRKLFNLLRGVVIKLHSNDLEIGNYNSIVQSINAERKRLNAPEFEQLVKVNHVSVASSFSVQYLYQQQLLVDVSGTGQTTAAKNKCKVEASEALYKLLRKYCYAVRPKVKFLTGESEVKKEAVEAGPSKKPATGSNIQQEGFDDQKIEENNIGFKMLKMLGWKAGSALGNRSDGIVDPVSLQIKIDKKAGFGLTASNNDTLDAQAVRKMLMDFKNSCSEYDLAFSADFTKEDRATIHTMARKMKLISKSFGGEASRQIVISMQKDSMDTIKNKLLAGDPLMLQRYEIIEPELEFARVGLQQTPVQQQQQPYQQQYPQQQQRNQNRSFNSFNQNGNQSNRFAPYRGPNNSNSNQWRPQSQMRRQFLN